MGWRDIDIGAVSAYAIAVEHGYTGTEEQWAVDQAKSGENAGIARKSADIAKNAANEAKNSLGLLVPKTENALNSITAKGDEQIAAVADRGKAEVKAVKDAGAEQSNALTAQGDIEQKKVIASGDEQVDRVVTQTTTSLNIALTEIATAKSDSLTTIESAKESASSTIKEAEKSAISNIGTGIDNTLTQSGKAADAKKTGDEISLLKNDLDDLYQLAPLVGEYKLKYTVRNETEAGNVNGLGKYLPGYVGSIKIGGSYLVTSSYDFEEGDSVRIVTSSYNGYSVMSTDRGNGNFAPILIVTDDSQSIITYNYTFKTNKTVAFSGNKNNLKIFVTKAKNLQNTKANVNDVNTLSERVTALESNSGESTIYAGIALLLRHTIIPDYYFAVGNSDEYIDGKVNDVGEKCFAFVADTHWDKNKKHSPSLIRYAMERGGISNVIFGGDLIGGDLTVEQTKLNAKVFMNEWRSAFGNKMLFTIGDHDLNTGDIAWNENMPYQVATGIYLPKSSDLVYDTNLIGKVRNDSEVTEWNQFEDEERRYLGGYDEFESAFKMHYSYDDTSKKIRYIILNTGGPMTYYLRIKMNVGENYYQNIIYLQLDFLADRLKTLPEGYSVVVSGHKFINSSHDFQVYGQMLEVAKMLSAFKAHRTVTINNPLTRTEVWYSNGDHIYDFTDSPTASKIIAVCGDTHHDSSCICHTVNGEYISESYYDSVVQGDDAILFINTHCDTFDGTGSATGGNQTKSSMEEGTITEQSFDIIHFNENSVVCTRIGSGDDRVFNY